MPIRTHEARQRHCLLPCCYNSTASRAHLRRARSDGRSRASRAGASSRGKVRRPGRPVVSGQGYQGTRRCGAAASLASFGRRPYGRELLPRTAAPPPAATGPRRNDPDAARHERDQAVTLAPGAPIVVRMSQRPAGTPSIFHVGPSTRKGTRRSFLAAPHKPLRRKHLRDPPLRAEPLPTRRA
jgi:hypothetical protein